MDLFLNEYEEGKRTGRTGRTNDGGESVPVQDDAGAFLPPYLLLESSLWTGTALCLVL